MIEANPIKVTLIVSTYNWPEALELCIVSCFNQSLIPDEIIIADDGSKNDTKELVESLKLKLKTPLIHVWHEDKGFRLGAIRNKAIAKAKYDYIIQIDGDLILHKDFVKDHLSIAKQNQFVSGNRALIKKEKSIELLNSSSKNNHFLSFGFFDFDRKYYSIKSKLLFYLNGLFKTGNNSYKYVLGANMAFWKKDLLAVNGYNEDIDGWGKEDNEIAVRLINLGLELLIVKNICITYHIHHKESDKSKADKNEKLLQTAIEEKVTVVKNGIEKRNDND